MNNLIGYQFNKWHVLKRLPNIKGVTYWLCRCQCGLEKAVNGNNLKQNKSKGCRQCMGRSYKGSKHPGWCGYGDISGDRWARIINSAKKRHKEFSISIKDAWNKFQEQNSKCAISGEKLDFSSAVTNTASLDRIDSSKGYIIGNIQWVHKIVNLMKQSLSDSEFISWCSKIVQHKLVGVN